MRDDRKMTFLAPTKMFPFHFFVGSWSGLVEKLWSAVGLGDPNRTRT